jgi:Sulfatase
MNNRTLVVAFSLGNLCFLSAWREVLSPQSFSWFFYWKQYPGYALGLAIILDVLVLASIFLFGHYAVKRADKPALHNLEQVFFVAILIRALNEFRTHFEWLSTGQIRMQIGQSGYVAVVTLFFVSLLIAVWRYGKDRLIRASLILVMILSPLGFLSLVEATWLAATYGPSITTNQKAAEYPRQKHGNRVVWVIFDEMGENLSFDARPATLKMPQFDRFRSEGLFALNAFPPAGHTTQSIPALLTGQLISDVKITGPHTEMLTIPAFHSSIDWSKQPDVFSDSLSEGFSTGLAGWYIPYCRLIGSHLNSCYWQPGAQGADPDKLDFMKDAMRWNAGLLYLVPAMGPLATNWLRKTAHDAKVKHIADYEAVLEKAKELIARRDINLAFVHLPVPHPPYVFERAGNAWTVDGDSGYLDNLAAADATLGELRKAMERGGTWEGTTVMVSSDHWWRSDLWENRTFWNPEDKLLESHPQDRRVPFLVKLAGKSRRSTYAPAFNTVLSHDLILEFLKGTITDTEQLASWLDAHRTIGESPYHQYD